MGLCPDRDSPGGLTAFWYDWYYGRLGIIYPAAMVEQSANGRVIKVPPGGNLQAALDLATSGDIVELQAGAMYNGQISAAKQAAHRFCDDPLVRRMPSCPKETAYLRPKRPRWRRSSLEWPAGQRSKRPTGLITIALSASNSRLEQRDVQLRRRRTRRRRDAA